MSHAHQHPSGLKRQPSAVALKVPTADRRGGRWRRGVDPEPGNEAAKSPEGPRRIGNPWRPGGRGHQEIFEEGTGVRAGRPNPRVGEECKEFMERSTKRISKLQELDAETVLLQESRARLARLAATPVTLVDTTHGALVVNLQLQAERDALCLE